MPMVTSLSWYLRAVGAKRRRQWWEVACHGVVLFAVFGILGEAGHKNEERTRRGGETGGERDGREGKETPNKVADSRHVMIKHRDHSFHAL
jgi:hypothetical protein